jgi:hypothetical protein
MPGYLTLADDGAEQTRGLIAVDRRGSAWLQYMCFQLSLVT